MASPPSPPARKNPKPLNPNAASFHPTTWSSKTEDTNTTEPKAVPTLFQESFFFPRQIFRSQPQAVIPPTVHGPLWALLSQGYSYHPDYVSQLRSIFSSYQGIACYDVFSQPRPVTHIPYQVGFSERYYGAENMKSCGIVQSAACRGKNKTALKGLKRFTSPRMKEAQKGRKDTLLAAKKAASEEVDGGVVSSPDLDHDHTILAGRTSVMIKNVPNQFERHDLLRILDKHCREENQKALIRGDPCESAYDFLYLPMDFRKRANLGYAFVNFTSAVAAARFFDVFHRYQWEVPQNKKICEISCAKYQGKEALRRQFENSRFPCHTSRYLPVVLSPPRDGWNRTRPTLVGYWTGAAAGSQTPPSPVNPRSALQA